MKQSLQRGLSKKSTLIGLLIGSLAVLFLATYGLWTRFGDDRDGSSSNPQVIVEPDPSTTTTTISGTTSPGGGTQNGRLTFRLSKGEAGEDTFELLPPTSGEPLTAAEIQAALDRLPPLDGEPDDASDFRLPEAILPPPQPGETVPEPFPVRGPAISPDVDDGPLEVLRFAPEGEIPLAPFLSATFNQPMVPLATVDMLSAVDAPVKLTPELPGIWRWLGTETLTFEYQGEEFDRFPMSTEYVAEIAAGTTSANGNALAETVTWHFRTPTLQLQSYSPGYGPQPLEPIMFAAFDQQIDATAVLEKINVTANGRSVSIQMASEEEIAADERMKRLSDNAADGRWLAFRAQEPLPTAATIQVEIEAGAPSAEGPLLTEQAQNFSFSTYDALKITDHDCGWYEEECPPFTPFIIHFNNPLDSEAFTPEQVTIEPALPGATIQVYGNRLEIKGATRGRTTYVVTVDGNVKDVFEQTLGKSEMLRFRVGSAPQALSGPSEPLVTLDPSASKPILSVYTINYDELEVKAYAVTPDEWADFHEYRDNYYRDDSPPKPPGRLILDETIRIEGEADVLSEVPIDLSEALENDFGHLVVVIEPPGGLFKDRWEIPRIQVWVQATQIGLDAVSDGQRLLAWTTDLQTGDPLSNLSVNLAPSEKSVVSDNDGLARFDLDEASGGLLVATQGNDSAILPANPYYWDQSGWQYWSQPDELRWYVFDDRQMYRPGEEVHLKGWVRQIDYAATGDVELPPNTIETISYQVMDPQYNEIGNGSVSVNALGGFDLNFTLPTNSNLGYAQLAFTANAGGNGREYWHSFQIQEFRRPEFSVSARTESVGPYFVGDYATTAVEASYFAGGALPDADVEWRVCAQPGSYSPPDWPDFTFGTWTPWWLDHYFYEDSYFDGPDYGGDGDCELSTGKTDATGTDYLRIDFEAMGEPQPFTLSAEGTVFDVNRQAWAASTNLLVHPSDVYVGIRSERAFVRRGEPLEMAAIVTDLDGNAVSGRLVTMTAARQEWLYRNGSWAEETTDLQTCTETSTDEPIICTFDTTHGGSYQITVTTTDTQDRANQSQMTRWVSGGQQRPLRNIEQETATLVPDKELYAPGDTAEILVQSPFGEAEGLMTVSRGPILYTEQFTVGEDGYILQIPITEQHLPDLTVQIDLVGSAARTDDAGEPLPDLPDRPAYATGQLSLNVSTASRALTVDVQPAQARLEPGEETAVNVTITDAQGRPVVGAEMAVVVVDEAVLALTNYQLNDPLATFYTMRGSNVGNTYGRSSIILSNPETLADDLKRSVEDGMTATTEMAVEEAESMAFDDAAGMAMPAAAPEEAMKNDGEDTNAGNENTPIRVRSDFNPLAVFSPETLTDSDGRARVAVNLPDNLTRYRIMVVAVADGQLYGTGESNLTARLPLMVRPSAPRFLNFGDQFELPVVLQNQTDADMSVDVVIQAGNIELIDSLDDGLSAGQRVIVPANDRVELRFPATTLSAGTARFQFAAISGNYADAATVELPVYTPATTEAFATYGVVDDGAIAQPVARPEGVFPQFGGLEVQTSATALQALTDAVLYLTQYPYECSEQVSSRVLAIAALRDVLTAFEAEGLPEPADLETAVQRDIEKLEGLQNNDGGWPIWRRGKESIPFYSIHTAHALQVAKEKGFTVSNASQQMALVYLQNIESYYPSWYSPYTRRSLSAYALNVRHQMGDSDPVKASNLLNEVALDDWSLEALGWLWPIFDGNDSYGSQVAAIGDHFNNRVVETAAAANFTTSYGDEAYLMLHSDRRTDGVILDSLIDIDPESDLIPKVVNGLLAHRTRGRWRNTQENVFILLAMDNYFNTFEAQTPDFVARIWLGDTYAGEHVYEGRTTERHETTIPMQYLVDGAELQNLVLDKEGVGRMYYRLGLSYAPDDLNLDPLDMGFTVQRIYEGVDDPEDVYRDDNGRWHIRAGARVRVKLTMVTSNRRYNVALVDPLPAGLEIINPALAVSGNVPQDPSSSDFRYGWWWWGTWYEHQNMRDERAEAFTTLLWDGVYNYSYVARATTPGEFVVPPAKAEEMYTPEVFGRSGSDLVIVE